MSYTTEQENYLEGAVADFDAAVSQRNWQEAAGILTAMKADGYDTAANKLAQELARKRLHDN